MMIIVWMSVCNVSSFWQINKLKLKAETDAYGTRNLVQIQTKKFIWMKIEHDIHAVLSDKNYVLGKRLNSIFGCFYLYL